MDYYSLWINYGGNVPCRRAVSSKYDDASRIFLSTANCQFFFVVVPILSMGVFSVTSIFSKLGKSTCFCPRASFASQCALFVASRCWALMMLSTIRVFLIVGFYVWPCRGVWKISTVSYLPSFSDADGSGESMLSGITGCLPVHSFKLQVLLGSNSAAHSFIQMTCLENDNKRGSND